MCVLTAVWLIAGQFTTSCSLNPQPEIPLDGLDAGHGEPDANHTGGTAGFAGSSPGNGSSGSSSISLPEGGTEAGGCDEETGCEQGGSSGNSADGGSGEAGAGGDAGCEPEQDAGTDQDGGCEVDGGRDGGEVDCEEASHCDAVPRCSGRPPRVHCDAARELPPLPIPCP